MFRAVVYDIDGTLTTYNSWFFLTEALGGSVDKHLDAYEAYKEGRVSYEESKRLVIEQWSAAGIATRARIRAALRKIPLDSEATELVNWFRTGGLLQCAITGSMDIYAKMIAETLSLDYWYANTTLRFSRRQELVDMDYRIDQEQTKLCQFSDFVTRHGFAPEEILVIGDGANDIRLFERTNNGIVVIRPETPASAREAARHSVIRLAEVPRIRSLLGSK